MSFVVKKIVGFPKGLNDTDPSTTLVAGELQVANNVRIYSKAVGARLGSKLSRDFTSGTVHSIFQFAQMSSGDRFEICGVADAVYSDGVSIASGLSGEKLSFAVIGSDLYFCDTVDIWKWTGLGSASKLAGAPQCKAITEHQGCLVALAISGGENAIQWSNFNDTSVWDVEDFLVMVDDDVEGVVGAIEYFNQFLVGKKTKLYLIDGFPSPTNQMRVPTKVGIASYHSLVQTSIGPMFLGLDGIYAIQNGMPVKMSEKVQTTIDDINPALRSKAHAIAFNDKYLLSFAAGSSTTNDTVLEFDIKNMAWSKWTGRNIEAFATSFNTTTDKEELFTGGTDSILKQEFFSSTDSDVAYRSEVKLAPILFNQEVSLFEIVAYVELYSDQGINMTYVLDSGTYASTPVTLTVSGTSVAFFDVSKFDESTFAGADIIRVSARVGGRCRRLDLGFYTDGIGQLWKLHRLEITAVKGAR